MQDETKSSAPSSKDTYFFSQPSPSAVCNCKPEGGLGDHPGHGSNCAWCSFPSPAGDTMQSNAYGFPQDHAS